MSEEIKIGMYTEDEIFEYMTDCEGSMLGRSMYDAIFDKIHSLITENQQLLETSKAYKKLLKTTMQKEHQAIKVLDEIREVINQNMSSYSSCIKAFDEIEKILDKVKE